MREAAIPDDRAQEALAEISRRSDKYIAQTHLLVDYYRIRQRVAYPLPIRAITHPDFTVREFNAAYPWSIWMSWALEERIGALGYAAELTGDEKATQAARDDLVNLCLWPTYLHDERPQLAYGHAVRTMWCAARNWTWVDDELRATLIGSLRRAVDEILPHSDRLHGAFSSVKAILEAPGRHSHLHNIPLIATLAAAFAARLSDHPASDALHRRVNMLVMALLELRGHGVTEAVSYDGYVLNFIADWMLCLSGQEQDPILDHPRFNDTLIQSCWLPAPGNFLHVAELGDVEPYEMPFHISAHAKLEALRADPLRAWYLLHCNLRALRIDALAALALSGGSLTERNFHHPTREQGGSVDANYAIVLRSGWDREDIAVAAGASSSPMSHIHRDNGSLVIGTRGRWAIEDAGYQQYLETAERNFTIGERAHNAPVINGFAQARKRLSERRHVTLADDIHVCHLNLTHSYPAEAGVKWLTRTIWLLGREHVVVCDQSAVPALVSMRYVWHGNRECAWWVENGVVSLHHPNENSALLYIASPQIALEPGHVTRLRGSRGQMSLMLDLRSDQQQVIANRRLVCWLFSTVKPPPIATQDWPRISVGNYQLDSSEFR